MKKDASAFGTILGFYIEDAWKYRMKRRLAQVSAPLKKNGIKRGRYRLELLRTTDWLGNGEPKYPLFYVVKIL
jgi:hypothetical protein